MTIKLIFNVTKVVRHITKRQGITLKLATFPPKDADNKPPSNKREKAQNEKQNLSSSENQWSLEYSIQAPFRYGEIIQKESLFWDLIIR